MGLLLGVDDDRLEQIEKKNLSSVKSCQSAVMEAWIQTEKANWSVLVEALAGPVLGERNIAIQIAQVHSGTRL